MSPHHDNPRPFYGLPLCPRWVEKTCLVASPRAVAKWSLRQPTLQHVMDNNRVV
jgi:hypothetical protein